MPSQPPRQNTTTSGRPPIAENLRRAQDERGHTNEEMARLAGVTLRVYQRWRAGEGAPRWENLTRLAAALELEPGWFYQEHAGAIG